MKFSFSILTFIFALLAWSACNSEDVPQRDQEIQKNLNENAEIMKDTIAITIGNKVFTAILEVNAAAVAFKAKLPLTVNMNDLNGNEKFVDLPNNLPTRCIQPTHH
jgi:hypothetical protein